MWSLSNAFTSAFKKLDPVPQFKATAKLGGFLAQLPHSQGLVRSGWASSRMGPADSNTNSVNNPIRLATSWNPFLDAILGHDPPTRGPSCTNPLRRKKSCSSMLVLRIGFDHIGGVRPWRLRNRSCDKGEKQNGRIVNHIKFTTHQIHKIKE
jgi:hypothetical protein